MLKELKYFFLIITLITAQHIYAQSGLNQYNVVWNSQSKNSSESMPCGGGDIGLNVWVENGELLFYMSQSGTFDENNQFLKAGRVRVMMSPNPFAGQSFKQELILKDGFVKINGKNGNLNAEVDVWVDVFNPMIHVDVNSNEAINTTASYESWRYKDRPLSAKENRANSWKWWPNANAIMRKDSISFDNNQILFYHRNKDASVFDVAVNYEGMDAVKDQLYNPLKHLTFGGIMKGADMKPAGTYTGKYLDTDFEGWKLQSKTAAHSSSIEIFLHTAEAQTTEDWISSVKFLSNKSRKASADISRLKTTDWWHQYWERSFVYINTKSEDTVWQAGRNYQLFRYMLGCNAFGKYPTKFNGGLFTFDPVFTDSSNHCTPDYRNWGGGTFTAQNQRLVYWPMLKSGDVDLMKSQFDFYLGILHNAELRSKFYWNHDGACFTEQIENFGLPNMVEYGLKRPSGYDHGMDYNAWLEYTWDTALEFCMMILETESYQNSDISQYIPFIKSCLIFFDEHYQYLAKQRGIKSLDTKGQLVLYPGSGAETYKMANNATSTIAALKTVINKLLKSQYIDDSGKITFIAMLKRIPPVSFANMNGHPTIAPAKSWERINNSEPTQLYPVFPWGIYGVGKPGLDTAINTWQYDTSAIKFRSAVGWKQDNIWAARLGLKEEAAELNVMKMKNSGRRFPAFWGPGFDWTPDHNWGGSGMIGMQEMLLQTDDKKIFLFPAWPKEWDVHFKLHAPYQTTVEAEIKNGIVHIIEVMPKERAVDVVNMFQ